MPSNVSYRSERVIDPFGSVLQYGNVGSRTTNKNVLFMEENYPNE